MATTTKTVMTREMAMVLRAVRAEGGECRERTLLAWNLGAAIEGLITAGWATRWNNLDGAVIAPTDKGSRTLKRYESVNAWCR